MERRRIVATSSFLSRRLGCSRKGIHLDSGYKSTATGSNPTSEGLPGGSGSRRASGRSKRRRTSSMCSRGRTSTLGSNTSTMSSRCRPMVDPGTRLGSERAVNRLASFWKSTSTDCQTRRSTGRMWVARTMTSFRRRPDRLHRMNWGETSFQPLPSSNGILYGAMGAEGRHDRCELRGEVRVELPSGPTLEARIRKLSGNRVVRLSDRRG